MTLLCACTDVEMCRDCKRANEILKAYETTKRQMLKDWNVYVDKALADWLKAQPNENT